MAIAGYTTAAISEVRAALVAEPTRAGLHHQLAGLLLEQEDWVGAARAYEAAARCDPNHAERWYCLGIARERLWDHAKACEAYELAVATGGSREEARERLARAQQAGESFVPFCGVLVAHRGAVRRYGENTLEAVAGLPDWVSGVEVDVQSTSDGVPVLMHDPTPARTTRVTGRVDQLTYAGLRAARAENGGRVPTLSSFLQLCEARQLTLVLLDLKSPTAASAEAVEAELSSSRIGDRCVVMVRSEVEVATVRGRSATRRLGMLGTTESNVAQRIMLARSQRLELLLTAHGSDRYLANRGVISALHLAGLRAGGSIINSREALEAAREDGCEVVLTDQIDQLNWYSGVAVAPR